VQPNLNVSSTALLFNAGRILVNLCTPFLDPADPKTVRIDLRYMSNVAANGRGGGRFLASDDAALAPVLSAGDDGDDSAGAPS
jgi:hypothetical protein